MNMESILSSRGKGFGQVIQETLRLSSIVRLIPRTVKQDVEINGTCLLTTQSNASRRVQELIATS